MTGEKKKLGGVYLACFG